MRRMKYVHQMRTHPSLILPRDENILVDKIEQLLSDRDYNDITTNTYSAARLVLRFKRAREVFEV